MHHIVRVRRTKVAFPPVLVDQTFKIAFTPVRKASIPIAGSEHGLFPGMPTHMVRTPACTQLDVVIRCIIDGRVDVEIVYCESIPQFERPFAFN